MAEIEIGRGKSARRGFDLDQLTLVPGRRTRDPELVDLSWQLDAYRLSLPFMAAPMDSVVSPDQAIAIQGIGGLAPIDLDGLWTRHEDAGDRLLRLAEADASQTFELLRTWYATPVDPDLLVERVDKIRRAGGLVAGAVGPKRLEELAPVLRRANLDLLVVHGTVTSAEHVSTRSEPLNLKTFVRELETPVLVGGCASYTAALHLMRTGAAGVLVGIDGGAAATSRTVTGLGCPQATAIADVRAARMRHLDETGVYVHVVADGGIRSGGDVAKAVALGADAVVLGSVLAAASSAPGHGWHWGRSVAHPTLPQGTITPAPPVGSLEEILVGPACGSDGRTNLFGALRQSMASLGFESVKELQKAEVVVRA